MTAGLAVGLVALAVPAAAPTSPALGDLRSAGTVYLEPSCAPEVRDDFKRATALLHSFFYDEARRIYADVAGRDPKCAIAHWGVAMSHWHPIWTPPSAEEMAAGRAAFETARKLGGGTALERGLIDALGAFYATPKATGGGEVGQSCHGPTGGGDHPARARAYADAMEKVQAQAPGDVEAAAFFALALLGSASPTDATLANAKRATALLEPFFAKHPRHPGVIHYLIHGYDYPPLAEKGLPAARAYAEVAPWVPHVLHMPAHIFTRLGMWKDVIASNLASAEAARQVAARSHPDATSFEELHALDYLVYGYLQTGQDGPARAVFEKTQAVRRTYPDVDFAASYALGAVPARYMLERRQWADAAALPEPAAASWAKMPLGAAHVAFARALGAARAGQAADARRAAEALQKVASSLTDPRQQYFGKQAAMQVGVVKGWLALVEGRPDEAERLLREAAETDDFLGKHPVSPGTILPAREVLADFLLERGRPLDALAEYEKCLKLNPGRLNGLFGAGRAAEAAGDAERARRHYADLVAGVVPDAARREVAHARAFLAGAQRAAR
jgi:tetratricopeptide (TPR) repeat protein